MPHEVLPFWHFNVAKQDRTLECPDYLKDADDRDRRLIGVWDEDYAPLTWAEVKEIAKTKRFDAFRRVPSELRRYRQFMYRLRQEYGSIASYVLAERLHWADLTPKGPPFTSPSDYKVLYNDWPYGLDKRIAHLVVWTKFELDEDPFTGQLTPGIHQQIEYFVQRAFWSRVGCENVIWFKNGQSLKSIRAVEHFHVLLFEADDAFLEEVTGGDLPASVEALRAAV